MVARQYACFCSLTGALTGGGEAGGFVMCPPDRTVTAGLLTGSGGAHGNAGRARVRAHWAEIVRESTIDRTRPARQTVLHGGTQSLHPV
ncbi:hypothetical protein GCM10017784_12260 [Deinococcus indicus]|nr:hypothetical protein GCM10017784_12260 [Deinococcus indicus]